MKAPALGWQLALAFILTVSFLVGFTVWLENVHILTANGMYKSIQAEPWINDYWHARLDPANYLYFPLYGVSAHLLDMLGILPGKAWQQFAYLNDLWAGLCIVVVYAFVHRLTGSALVAALAALFHLGSGFVVGLAVTSEDIMPAYTLVLASMMLGALWFDRPTYRRLVAVAVLFTLGWLIEWRLIFPTLSAFLLALAIADAPVAKRAAWIATLLVTIVALTGIVQQIWEGHNGAMGLPDLLWTGKGMGHFDSGWGGMDWAKLWMMLSGIGDYFLDSGPHFDPATVQAGLAMLSLSVALQLAIFLVGCVMLWPQRHDRRLRCVAVIFLGTLGAGEAMNFYSQPQDPQMQINVMPWLTVTWALIVAGLVVRRDASSGAPTLRAGFLVPLAVLSLLPLVLNVHWLARSKGGDARAVAAVADLERAFPPDSTVYLYWGFEYIETWQFALLEPTWDWGLRRAAGPRAPGETALQVDFDHRRRRAPRQLDARAARRGTQGADRAGFAARLSRDRLGLLVVERRGTRQKVEHAVGRQPRPRDLCDVA